MTSGITVRYTDAYDTEKTTNFPNAKTFDVKDGMLYLANEEGAQVTVAFAPGKWDCVFYEG